MRYQTNINPQSPNLLSRMPEAPYSYPGTFGDSYNALKSGLEANMEMANRDANLAMQNRKLTAQRDTALSGLQNLAQAEEQQSSLRNQQRGMQLGLVNSLLSGLFS